MNEIKTAVILPNITPATLEFGGLDPYGAKTIFPDGSLIPYLPEFEPQSHVYGDDYGCVSHSLQNAIEALIRAHGEGWPVEGIMRNGYPNFSDRDLVVLSGTKPGIGNSGEKVLATAQAKGLISQILGDWDPTNRDPSMTMERYYAYARTKEAEEFAKKFNETFEITGVWVYRDKWEQAAKEGALQVYVNAWYRNSQGKYYNPNGKHNHAVLMADYKNVKIYDTYKPEIKELVSWADAYDWALKLNINLKVMEKPIIANNTLVQLVEGQGGFGLYLDGKIIVDDLAKIIASWLVRNAGKLDGKTRALTQEAWAMFPKYNLKMEKL